MRPRKVREIPPRVVRVPKNYRQRKMDRKVMEKGI